MQLKKMIAAVLTALVLTTLGSPLPSVADANPGVFSLNVNGAAVSDVARMLELASGENIVADSSTAQIKVTLQVRNVTLSETLSVLQSAYGLSAYRVGQTLVLGTTATVNQRYGTAGSQANGSVTRTFALRNGVPQDVATELQAQLQAGAIVVPDKRLNAVMVTGDQATIDRATEIVNVLDSSSTSTQFGSMVSQTLKLKYMDAKDMVTAMTGLVPAQTVVADDQANSLILVGTADQIAIAKQIASNFDQPRAQADFQVQVVDVTPLNDNWDVGVAFGGLDLSGTNAAQTIGVPSLWNIGTPKVSATLRFLENNGHARLLARPNVLATSGTPASLLVGEQYPIQIATLNAGTQTITIQYQNVGVQLKLTPTIGADGTIATSVDASYSQIFGFSGQYPIVGNREVTSVMHVKDGQSIVLAGLFQDVDQQTILKFPILSDLPLIGTFFKEKIGNRSRDELVFIITPRIVKDGSDNSAADPTQSR